MSREYTCTNKHLKIFKKECEYWIEHFGLKHLFWTFCLTDVACLSCVYYDDEAKNAAVALATDWGEEKPTNYKLRECAFHETLEGMFAPIEDCAAKKRKKEARKHVHELIAILQETVFKPDHIKRFGKGSIDA